MQENLNNVIKYIRGQNPRYNFMSDAKILDLCATV